MMYGAGVDKMGELVDLGAKVSLTGKVSLRKNIYFTYAY